MGGLNGHSTILIKCRLFPLVSCSLFCVYANRLKSRLHLRFWWLCIFAEFDKGLHGQMETRVKVEMMIFVQVSIVHSNSCIVEVENYTLSMEAIMVVNDNMEVVGL